MSDTLDTIFDASASARPARAERSQPTDYKVLVLNADHSVFGSLNWREVIRGLAREIIYPIAHYDAYVRSPSTKIQIPSVAAFFRYVDTRRPASLTRWNLFVAYDMRCCLCGLRFPTEELTIEHLLPQSRSGVTSWTNCLPACGNCNNRKGDRTLEEAGLTLAYPMRQPTGHDIAMASLRIDFPEPPHESWMDYISRVYWDAPLRP